MLQIVQKRLNAFLGQGDAANHHLQTIIFRWIMAAGDHDARTGLQFVGREIE